MLTDDLLFLAAANMAEEVKPGVSYTIGGVKVEFPVKAYPSQVSMMDKVCKFIVMYNSHLELRRKF